MSSYLESKSHPSER